ncbi:cytochrome P450 [Irpex rosettiformis]|uniref:Cytochrome P450 n=1 Tax=Irpex rosettiformis TaxID=378272 RepID=A0ACB8U511_9APHY|nr:cytochrome P450 [Irpex rosettiformis]
MPPFSTLCILTTTQYLILVISLFVLYLTVLALYRLFFSPLAAVPGPWYAAVSDLWIISHVVRMQQCRTVQSLFEKYGPVVRIGPNKVAFCDATTMRSVYCVHKFDKSPYYKSLLTNNNDHAMTTLPHAEHVIRKKSYSPHYIPSNLALFQPELQDFSYKLTDILERIGGKTSVESLDMFRHFMVDIISCTVFGVRNGSLENWASNVRDPVTAAVYDFPVRGILRSAVPTWAWSFVCRAPSDRVREICNSDNIMAEFVGDRLYEMRTNIQAGKVGIDGDSEKMPLIQRMLQYRILSEGMCDQDIISEAMGHLVAGVDTSSLSLAYMFWELSRRRDITQRLQAELDDAMTDKKVIPDINALMRLPYLNAFIKEAMRVYGAAPSLLERVVPSRACGAVSKLDEDFDMMGYALPPGTVVSTQAWSMHRDAEIFPSPETFLPERWLAADGSDAEEERLSRMAQQLIPFGVGTRVCGGQNLAQIVLRMVVAVVVRNFNVIAKPEETNERTMEIRDAFTIFPASKECKLTFVPRSH